MKITNIQKLELFFHDLVVARGKDPLDPDEPINKKIKMLIKAIADMTSLIGDDKTNTVFKNTLIELITSCDDEELKDTYIEVLNKFNTNIINNLSN